MPSLDEIAMVKKLFLSCTRTMQTVGMIDVYSDKAFSFDIISEIPTEILNALRENCKHFIRHVMENIDDISDEGKKNKVKRAMVQWHLCELEDAGESNTQ